MDRVGVLCLLVVLLALAESTRIRRDDKYTTRYDNIDLDEILNSDRLMLNYHRCLMDRGKCTPDGEELRQHIPDALQTECSKCSEKQKDIAEKVIKFLIEERPKLWKELADKYDPDAIYRKKYEEEIERVKQNSEFGTEKYESQE